MDKYEKYKGLSFSQLMGDEDFMKELDNEHNLPLYESKIVRGIMNEAVSKIFNGLYGEVTVKFDTEKHELIFKSDIGDPQHDKNQNTDFEIVSSKYPKNFISQTDKLSNHVFQGDLTGLELKKIAMERRGSKKEITTSARIDLSGLEPYVKGLENLTPYDRDVHDSIVSLVIDGDNDYITPQMIYRTMTGNPKARLVSNQFEAINKSITVCMYTKIEIEANSEAEAHKFKGKGFVYDGNLISAERVTAVINGEKIACIRVLRPPILYEYADKKNQISRFDINLLRTPVNKTGETIPLQSYLLRRISSMKYGNQSRSIVYETIYKHIGVEGASEGAIRKKKSKVRDQIRTMLDYWKKEDYIKGYKENKKGNTLHSMTIEL